MVIKVPIENLEEGDIFRYKSNPDNDEFSPCNGNYMFLGSMGTYDSHGSNVGHYAVNLENGVIEDFIRDIIEEQDTLVTLVTLIEIIGYKDAEKRKYPGDEEK